MGKGRRTADGIEREGRRAVLRLRKADGTTRSALASLTLGDLVAAAFDTMGDVDAVATLLSSRELARAVGRRIVCV